MLSHKVLSRKDTGRSANYYIDGADDYYAKDGEASQWQGNGAKALGLSGPVDAQRFKELLAGHISDRLPNARMTARHDSKSRIAIDLTFSPPKSVSLQGLVHGDKAIIAAHDKAVSRAIEHAEGRAQARQRDRGKVRIENTGNLIVAKFRHETSREKDPQLHTHAVVMNLTRRADGTWRALKNDEIIKATKYLESVYLSELAIELQRSGYTLRYGREGEFELSHIDRKQIEAFSKRSKQIEQELAAFGMTRETSSMLARQVATYNSRAPKGKEDRAAIFAEWQQRSRDLGIDYGRRELADPNAPIARSLSELPEQRAADRALRYAISHLTERQAIVGEREMLDVALKHGMGAVRYEDVVGAARRLIKQGYLIREDTLYRPAVDYSAPQGKTRAEWIAELTEQGVTDAKGRVERGIRAGGLVPMEARYTTQTGIDREVSTLKAERAGRGAVAPIVRAVSDVHMAGLNAGQRAAAELIATTTNRVIGVQGFAGTGKSHMLHAAKRMVEAEGYRMASIAPYGAQVKALRDLKTEARVLASWLRSRDKGIDERTVVVLDEAGVVPARLMEQTLRLIEKSGARIVLVGDNAQTKAIEAGRPFDQLQAAGMAVAGMTEIRRQQDPELKQAVELAAHGRAAASLAHIAGITEIPDDSKRRAAVAERYVGLPAADRDKTIIVSGTNEARRQINQQVREKLGMAGTGREYDTLTRSDTTQAERRYAKTYRIGDLIQPERDYAKLGLARGELYRIEDTGPTNHLTVSRVADPSQRVVFSPMLAAKLSVYQPERTELAAGDTVRITRNDAKLDLANGDRFTVAAVAADRVSLSDGQRTVELPTDRPLHLDHAYATTVHSSQGLTSDRVLIDAQTASRTTAKDVYYVAISRARHEAIIYTNDRAKLPAAIERENAKHAAMDLRHRAVERREHALGLA